LQAPETKASGFQGDPSATEGKTAQSIQWKVQYQSGWEAQSVNPTFSLVKAVNSRTSYGKRANTSRVRDGHKTTRRRIINRREDCSFHKWKVQYQSGCEASLNIVSLAAHQQRGRLLIPTNGRFSTNLGGSQAHQVSRPAGGLYVGTFGSLSGDGGEPSLTEGKTAHSIQRKVQYQSGHKT